MSAARASDPRRGAAIRRRLLAYYDGGHRDLPWRTTRDPYRIWLSEIMLQQTRVETVEPRYRRFLERFPTVDALAAASVEEVCEEWAGLGYYSRARNLHSAARQVVEEHGGRLPAGATELRRLPGIGRYTAGAISSIAYGLPEPVVDGNVARVLSRLDAVSAPASSAAGSAYLWALAGTLARGPRAGDVNQALMELGATVCTPRAPRCESCPLRSGCVARAQGSAESYPRKKAAAARRRLKVAFAWIEGRSGVWLERRPLEGLWGGMWQLPGAEGPQARGRLAERLGIDLGRPIAEVEHRLSHRDVHALVYRAATAHGLRRSGDRAPYPDPLAAPLSALARKAVRAAKEQVFK